MGRNKAVNAMNIITNLIAGLLAGIIGAMGLGGGGVLLIYLTVFAGIQQIEAQGINLIFFLPCAVTAIIIYSKKSLIKWRIVLPYAIFGILGTIIGSFLTDIIGGQTLQTVFGAGLLLLGIKELFFKQNKKQS